MTELDLLGGVAETTEEQSLCRRGAAIRYASSFSADHRGAALAELMARAIECSNDPARAFDEPALAFYTACAELARSPIPLAVALSFASA